jgi:hypothetical protein
VDIESLQLLGGLSAGTDWKGQAVPARTDGVAMVPIRIQALYLSVYNHGQAATNLLDFVPHSAVGGPAMTVKIDGVEPNIFPDIEDLDVRDAGRNVAQSLAHTDRTSLGRSGTRRAQWCSQYRSLRLVLKETTLRSIDVATHSQPIEYGTC